MPDRRRSARREVSLEARIKATSTRIDLDVPGEIVNMSGCGALVAVPGEVPVGTRVQIRADWPAVRADRRGAILVVIGKVVRSQPGFAAVEIGRYAIQPIGR